MNLAAACSSWGEIPALAERSRTSSLSTPKKGVQENPCEGELDEVVMEEPAATTSTSPEGLVNKTAISEGVEVVEVLSTSSSSLLCELQHDPWAMQEGQSMGFDGDSETEWSNNPVIKARGRRPKGQFTAHRGMSDEQRGSGVQDRVSHTLDEPMETHNREVAWEGCKEDFGKKLHSHLVYLVRRVVEVSEMSRVVDRKRKFRGNVSASDELEVAAKRFLSGSDAESRQIDSKDDASNAVGREVEEVRPTRRGVARKLNDELSDSSFPPAKRFTHSSFNLREHLRPNVNTMLPLRRVGGCAGEVQAKPTSVETASHCYFPVAPASHPSSLFQKHSPTLQTRATQHPPAVSCQVGKTQCSEEFACKEIEDMESLVGDFFAMHDSQEERDIVEALERCEVSESELKAATDAWVTQVALKSKDVDNHSVSKGGCDEECRIAGGAMEDSLIADFYLCHDSSDDEDVIEAMRIVENLQRLEETRMRGQAENEEQDRRDAHQLDTMRRFLKGEAVREFVSQMTNNVDGECILSTNDKGPPLNTQMPSSSSSSSTARATVATVNTPITSNDSNVDAISSGPAVDNTPATDENYLLPDELRSVMGKLSQREKTRILKAVQTGQVREVTRQDLGHDEYLMESQFNEFFEGLYNNECIGEGVGEGSGRVLRSRELREVDAQDGGGDLGDNIVEAAADEEEEEEEAQVEAGEEDIPDWPPSPHNALPDLEFHDGMIFQGDDYAVNIHRNIEINARQVEFGEGLVREIVYKVHFDQSWHNVVLAEVLGELLDVVHGIIERLRECYSPSDLVRFYLSSRSFNCPKSIGLMPLRNMDVGQVESFLQTVLQSDEYLFLDEPLEIQVAVIRNPQGAGKRVGLEYIFGEGNSLHLCKAISQTRVKDNLCLARSLVVALAKLQRVECERTGNRELIRRAQIHLDQLYNGNRPVQTREAKALHSLAGFPPNYTPAFSDIAAFERAVNTQVIVFQSGTDQRPVYIGSEERQRTVYLFYAKMIGDDTTPGHFHAIVNLGKMFRRATFCVKCKECYAKKAPHKCVNICRSCGTESCPVIEKEKTTCMSCNRVLYSTVCFDSHIAKGVCSHTHRCLDCGFFYRPSADHRCGYRLCNVCKQQVTGVHYCYIRQKKPKAISAKYMYADFETDPTGDVHKPNLVVAHWQCEHCEGSSYRENTRCAHCGTPCTNCRSSLGSRKRGDPLRMTCMRTRECGRRGVDFFGVNVARDFCLFFFDRPFEGFTLLFHNGQAYDCYFLMEYVLSVLTKVPRVICRGSKVMSIDTGKFRIIDSLNFLTMALAQMPSVFGLKGIRKGTFPVFFNQKENWDYVGPMPHPYCYRVNSMKPKVREEFMVWYKQQRGKVFDFRKEIYQYCEDDVNILQESCNAFRSWLLGISSRDEVIDVGGGGERLVKTVGVDPFQYNTLAGVCMATYRYLFLTEEFEVATEDGRTLTEYNTNDAIKLYDSEGTPVDADSVQVKTRVFRSTPFARMPSTGFSGLDNHSRSSIIWLEHEARSLNIDIKHARNGGEHRVPNTRASGGWLKLDGYYCDQDTGRETAWEFMGCVFHGCRKCYTKNAEGPTLRHPHTGEPLSVLYERTMSRLNYLRNDLKLEVRVIWECEFNVMLKEDPRLQELSVELDLQPRLDPREAFYGGRTNAVKLYREAAEGMKIGYVDICSLYPMVLKNDVFPVGIPDVITSPESNDISQYFGIVQCRVRPPRALYHPCLPVRCNGKLMFPLCRTCADALSGEKCTCRDDKRDLYGTWTTVDLEDALTVGYVIVKVYEIYHFRKRAQYNNLVEGSGLFSGYVNLFLKGKQEASGWPKSDMSSDEKSAYIEEYARVEGIELEAGCIVRNTGKRATNKLLLNSFWGKFGESNNHRIHKLVTDAPELFKILGDHSIILKDAHVFAKDRCFLQYEHAQGFIPEMSHVNVFVAAFTTSNARSRLYQTLQGLGERVLYFDTDSVVYEYDEGNSQEYKPAIGDHLGQWTNELASDEHITRFVSSGPKSYAFLTNKGANVVKLKGQTLNHENAQKLSFEAICWLVLFWADPDAYPLPLGMQPYIEARYDKIRRCKKRFILFSREELKKFRVTYNKRQLVRGTFDTLPYGY